MFQLFISNILIVCIRYFLAKFFKGRKAGRKARVNYKFMQYLNGITLLCFVCLQHLKTIKEIETRSAKKLIVIFKLFMKNPLPVYYKQEFKK